MKVIEKVISGVCSGVDQGGTLAAADLGIPTGGWDWHPGVWEEYGVKDVDGCKLGGVGHNRTKANAVDSDCTLHFENGGEFNVTGPYLIEYHKPHYRIPILKGEDGELSIPAYEDSVEAVREWLVMGAMWVGHPLVVNIAGNAGDEYKGLTYGFLTEVLTPLWKPVTVLVGQPAT